MATLTRSSNRSGSASVAAQRHWNNFMPSFPASSSGLAPLPRQRNPLDCPRVLVTGDFFTRFSPFFMEGVRELYNDRGIILKPVDLNGLLLYGAYNMVHGAASRLGIETGRHGPGQSLHANFPTGRQRVSAPLARLSDREKIRRILPQDFSPERSTC